MARTDSTWIQTYSGRQFWPLDPRPGDLDIGDIAHALANICRYNGHTRAFYSVAQHSVLVSLAVPAEDAPWGLMHDAAEAYMADVVRPIKRAHTLFALIEDRLLATIAERYALPLPVPATIAAADLALLAAERRDLMAPPPAEWLEIERTPPWPTEPIDPLPPTAAKEAYLERYYQLFNSRPATRPYLLALDDAGRKVGSTTLNARGEWTTRYTHPQPRVRHFPTQQAAEHWLRLMGAAQFTTIKQPCDQNPTTRSTNSDSPTPR